MSKDHGYVLGINAYDHDVSACLLRDGDIAFAIAKERITREKHDTGFYQEVVDYCLSAEGITLDDIDLVVRNCYVLPVHELEIRMVSQDVPEIMDDKERTQAANNPLYLSKSPKVVTVSHHLAHAYSAFAVCPFDEGAVMVVDGVGNYSSDITEPGQLTEKVNPLARESESYYRFRGSQLETLRKVWLQPVRGFLSDEFYYMPGLGALYSRVSSYIFADWNKCGEVMGLAPYGRRDAAKPLLALKDGELDVPEWGVDFNKPWLPDRERNWETSAAMQHWKDLAWRVQDDAERVLLQRAIWLRETTGARNLCLAGGVALNCVANGRIAREAGFENVWIQPAAGDDGVAIGCAYYGRLALQKKQRSFVMNHAFLGRPYRDDEARAATQQRLVRLQTTVTRTDNYLRGRRKIAGRGQRARLVSRRLRIRAARSRQPQHPRGPPRCRHEGQAQQAGETQAGLPAVRAHCSCRTRKGDFRRRAGIALHAPGQARAPAMGDRIPAIVHVDGTARLQTVRQEHNARLYRLLQEFEAITGVPVLLNTSFNIRGAPIVETPADALSGFLLASRACKRRRTGSRR